MPKDVGEWRALAATIAERYSLDEKKKARTRKKYDTGLCEEPDAYGPIEIERGRDPVDASRQLAVLKELFDAGRMPPMGGEILWGVADELSHAEIAEETGLEERPVRHRLQRMRDLFYRRIVELGLLTVVMLGGGCTRPFPADRPPAHATLRREAG